MLSEFIHKCWGIDDESDSSWTPKLENSMKGHCVEKSDTISGLRPYTQLSKDCLGSCSMNVWNKWWLMDSEVGWCWFWVQETENLAVFGLNNKDVHWLTELDVQAQGGLYSWLNSVVLPAFLYSSLSLSPLCSGFIFRWVWRGCSNYPSHLLIVMLEDKIGSFWKFFQNIKERLFQLLPLLSFSLFPKLQPKWSYSDISQIMTLRTLWCFPSHSVKKEESFPDPQSPTGSAPTSLLCLPLLPLSPLSTLLQPHWLPCCFSRILCTFPPLNTLPAGLSFQASLGLIAHLLQVASPEDLI